MKIIYVFVDFDICEKIRIFGWKERYGFNDILFLSGGRDKMPWKSDKSTHET